MLDLSSNPQLLLDDYVIARVQNVRRELQQPARHAANPLIVQDQPWEVGHISVYGTVLQDPETGGFRCWYQASRGKSKVPDVSDGPVTVKYYACHAESEDGIVWTKPLVGPEPFGEFERNNVVLPGSHSICVIHTPDDPDPARRYKSAGGPLQAFSPDGIRWDASDWKYAVGKNDTGTSVVRWGGQWLAYVRNQEFDERPSGNLQRAVAVTRSDDFVRWTPKETIWMTDAEDGYPWTQPYGLCASAYGDQLIAMLPLVCLEPIDGNNALGDMEVQVMSSRDGRNWHRVADRAVFLAGGPGGPIEDRPWDNSVYPSSTLLTVDDEVRLYYSGTNGRHGEGKTPEGKAAASKSRSGIGLATLPAERFVAVRPADGGAAAVLETKALRFSGEDLLVNAALGDSPDQMRVDVLDAGGGPIGGCGADICRLIAHDKLRYRVIWEEGGEARSLKQAAGGGPVALRFTWTEGDFFAFQVPE